MLTATSFTGPRCSMMHLTRSLQPGFKTALLLLCLAYVSARSNEAAAYVQPDRPASAGKTDWIEAELTIRNFPPKPSPDLQSDELALLCLRGLQLVDHPYENAGLNRIFPFLTWECRSAVTSRGGIDDTIDKFRERAALSPVLQTFMGASRITLGENTISPGTATRGDICSYPVRVEGSLSQTFCYKSGMMKNAVSNDPPVANMIVRLERCRRPPNSGCWMMKDIADVKYAKGGLGWSRHEGV